MSCPYVQPNCQVSTVPADSTHCPQCQGFLKLCPECGVRNRAFANYCCSCRAKLPAASGNWLGYKGGSQRLGLNTGLGPAVAGPDRSGQRLVEKNPPLQLGDSCRSLLGYDRHLIAVSQSGTIEIRDPERPAASLRLKADGPISCEPCIEEGILYLGSPGRLTAYSLGGLTLKAPRLSPLWQIPLSGTPVQALTPQGNRLYVNVVQTNGRKEVQVIDHLERNPPPPGQVLHTAGRISWSAADPRTGQVVFFSEDGGRTALHTVTPGVLRAEVSHHPLSRALLPFADNIPIAVAGGKIFGVFGEDEKLCHLDIRTGEREQSLGSDIKLFSFVQEQGRDWDGDGVAIDSHGVRFLRSNVKDSFAPLERPVKGSPLIVQDRAVVIGLQDGRIRVYDLLRLPYYESLRLTNDGEPITALASFRSYIAAGNVKGVVRLFELISQENPA